MEEVDHDDRGHAISCRIAPVLVQERIPGMSLAEESLH